MGQARMPCLVYLIILAMEILGYMLDIIDNGIERI
jgi:hypothetical protein